MILEHRGARPTIDADVRKAPNAVICGDVTIGPNCSIGFGAVITAESGPVRIGSHCVILDTAVIRGIRDNPVEIGENVLVGPRAYLVGCTVEEDTFLAMGATVLNGARLGRRAEVQVNGIVHIRTILPEGATVPMNWIAVGNPAQILPPDKHDEIWAIQKPLDFSRYVFGVERPTEGQSIMPDEMPHCAAALRRWHKGNAEATGARHDR